MLMCFVSVIQQINVESFLSLFPVKFQTKQIKTKPSQTKNRETKPHYNAYQPVI